MNAAVDPEVAVEFILLGPSDDRRQLQDSPILGDVWIAFGKQPAERRDLLISPWMTKHAGIVAAVIDKDLEYDEGEDPASIAYLQGLVAARLTFDEVLNVVVPNTKWWVDKWTKRLPPRQAEFGHEVTRRYREPGGVDIAGKLREIIQAAQDWNSKALTQRRPSDLVPLDRFAVLAGLILWASSQADPPDQHQPAYKLIGDILDQAEKDIDKIVEKLANAMDRMLKDEAWKKKTQQGAFVDPLQKADPLVFQVSLNRDALPALTKSIPAVKADAATAVFKVDCSQIGWAVLGTPASTGNIRRSAAPLGARSASSAASISGTSARS